MLWLKVGLGVMIGANILLLASLALRPRGKRRLGLVPAAAFLLLPSLATVGGGLTHLEQSKSTRFCLSCHVMEPYGVSLLIDDEKALPAQHYQNRRVPRQQACYRCHTDYTLHGNLMAKLDGVMHLYVNYLGTLPRTLQIYHPYPNSECLQCHEGARSFEEQGGHLSIRRGFSADEVSCLECHGPAHDIAGLKTHSRWQEDVE